MTTTLSNGGPEWTVVASSDGTTKNSGNWLSTYSSGANGLGNSGAWFILRAPGGNPVDGYKEFSFQRLSGDNSFRVKYTSVGFDVATGTATAVPYATLSDERVILGGGTDANPTSSYLINSSYTSQALIAHFCAQDPLDGYGFYLLANKFSTPAGFFAFDPMVTGTYPSQPGADDKDPFVTMFDNTSSVLSASSIYTPSSYSTCYLRKGMSGEGAVRIQGFYPVLYGNCQIVGNLPSNPYNGKDDTFPLLYARKGSESPPNGYKGQSLLLRWHGQGRGNFQIFSIDSAGDRLIVGNVSIPWNNTQVTI